MNHQCMCKSAWQESTPFEEKPAMVEKENKECSALQLFKKTGYSAKFRSAHNRAISLILDLLTTYTKKFG